MVSLVCAWPVQAPLVFQRNYIRNNKNSLRIDTDVLKLEVSTCAWFGIPPSRLGRSPPCAAHKPHVRCPLLLPCPRPVVCSREVGIVCGADLAVCRTYSGYCLQFAAPHGHHTTTRYTFIRNDTSTSSVEFRNDAPTLHVTGLAARAPHASTPCIRACSRCSSPAACGRSSRSIGTWPRALLGS
jgi:hypothetical protein